MSYLSGERITFHIKRKNKKFPEFLEKSKMMIKTYEEVIEVAGKIYIFF